MRQTTSPTQQEFASTRSVPTDDILNPVDARISADLEHAVAIWFLEYGDQFEGRSYSTAKNVFLHVAESAYFDGQREWRMVEEQRRISVAASSEQPSGFYVYRLWTESDGLPDKLVYVGSTRRLSQRISRHRQTMGDLWTRATWECYGTPAEMLAAEREAIATEFPAMNVAGV